MTKPRISVFVATSLDGYIARENDSLDWLLEFNPNGEDYGFAAFFASVDAMVVGRRTYENALKFGDWSFARKRVIVMSDSLETVCEHTELYKGDLPSLIEKLQLEGIKHIYVDGGTTITRFLKADLVDQLIISVIPIILGSGIRLFNRLEHHLDCHLKSSTSYATGLVQLTYEIIKKS